MTDSQDNPNTVAASKARLPHLLKAEALNNEILRTKKAGDAVLHKLEQLPDPNSDKALIGQLNRASTTIMHDTLLVDIETAEGSPTRDAAATLAQAREFNKTVLPAARLPEKAFADAAKEIARIHALEVGTEQKAPASTPAKEKPPAQGVYRI